VGVGHVDQSSDQPSSALVFLVCPSAAPPWAAGPLPLPIPSSARAAGWATSESAGFEARSAYFDAGLSGVLYGTSDAPVRWWTDADATLGGAVVWGIEVLMVPVPGPTRALLILHITLPAGGVGLLEPLVRLRDDSQGTTAEELKELLPDGWTLAPEHRRATSVSFAAEGAGPNPDIEEAEAGRGSPTHPLTDRNVLLWTLASATTLESFVPSQQNFDEGRLLDLSASWSCFVLRDGVGFVMHDQADRFASMARILTHTVYLDVMLLVRVQLLLVSHISIVLSSHGLTRGTVRDLINLERDLFDFRRRAWWTTAGEHAIANALLKAWQGTHLLPQRVDGLIADVGDAARLAQSIGAARAGSALAVISLAGVPLTVAYAGAALLPWHGWITLLIATAVAAVLSLVLATLTPLRELLGGWFGAEE